MRSHYGSFEHVQNVVATRKMVAILALSETITIRWGRFKKIEPRSTMLGRFLRIAAVSPSSEMGVLE